MKYFVTGIVMIILVAFAAGCGQQADDNAQTTDQAQAAIDEATAAADSAADQAQAAIDEATAAADSAADQAQEAIDEATAAADSAMGEVEATADSVMDQAQEAVDEVQDVVVDSTQVMDDQQVPAEQSVEEPVADQPADESTE